MKNINVIKAEAIVLINIIVSPVKCYVQESYNKKYVFLQ